MVKRLPTKRKPTAMAGRVFNGNAVLFGLWQGEKLGGGIKGVGDNIRRNPMICEVEKPALAAGMVNLVCGFLASLVRAARKCAKINHWQGWLCHVLTRARPDAQIGWQHTGKYGA